MKWHSLLLIFLLSLVISGVWAAPGESAGPWNAQIIDAETKQPLGGAVVLAWWTRHVRSFGGPSSEYYDSQEVLTDKEGRFAIAARSFFSFNPLVFFRGPRFLIFKPGYGRGIWPGGKERERWPEENLDSIVIQMPRLRSLDERRQFIVRGLSTPDIPLEKMLLLEKAITEERRAVGYRD